MMKRIYGWLDVYHYMCGQNWRVRSAAFSWRCVQHISINNTLIRNNAWHVFRIRYEKKKWIGFILMYIELISMNVLPSSGLIYKWMIPLGLKLFKVSENLDKLNSVCLSCTYQVVYIKKVAAWPDISYTNRRTVKKVNLI